MNPCHFAHSRTLPLFSNVELELKVRKVLHYETVGHSHTALSHPGGWTDPLWAEPPGSCLLPPSSASTLLPQYLLAVPCRVCHPASSGVWGAAPRLPFTFLCPRCKWWWAGTEPPPCTLVFISVQCCGGKGKGEIKKKTTRFFCSVCFIVK